MGVFQTASTVVWDHFNEPCQFVDFTLTRLPRPYVLYLFLFFVSGGPTPETLCRVVVDGDGGVKKPVLEGCNRSRMYSFGGDNPTVSSKSDSGGVSRKSCLS